MSVYPVHESVYDRDWRNRRFLNVINKGTPAFTKNIQRIMNKLPFQSLLDNHVRNLKTEKANNMDDKRGNYQDNLGVASGQCLSKKGIEKNFGAAMPVIRNGTMENLAIMKDLSELGGELGMCITDPQFLAQNPLVARDVEYLQELFGPGVVHALVSIAFLKMDKSSKVDHHYDKQNGERAPEVLIASKILKDEHGE